jgi:hypothetical protein
MWHLVIEAGADAIEATDVALAEDLRQVAAGLKSELCTDRQIDSDRVVSAGEVEFAAGRVEQLSALFGAIAADAKRAEYWSAHHLSVLGMDACEHAQTNLTAALFRLRGGAS